MIPSVDERLASIVRALSDVVLPSLPAEAGLAQEQVQLAIGQLKILRAQLDDTPAFEQEEYEDARSLAEALIGSEGAADRSELRSALDATANADDPRSRRSGRIAIKTAIADLIAGDGLNPATTRLIIASEKKRVVKERAWFAPFGFDIAPPTA